MVRLDEMIRNHMGPAFLPQAGVTPGAAVVASAELADQRGGAISATIVATMIIFGITGPCARRLRRKKPEQYRNQGLLADKTAQAYALFAHTPVFQYLYYLYIRGFRLIVHRNTRKYQAAKALLRILRSLSRLPFSSFRYRQAPQILWFLTH